MAQGSKLTEDQIARVADALGTSPSWRAAADHAGIHEDTIHLYRRLAQNYTNRHKEDQNLQDETDIDWWQWHAVQQWTAARSRLEMRLVQGIVDAGPKDWKAYHAMLKSGWPQDYSERLEVTGAGGGPIEVSVEELGRRAEEALERAQAKRDAAGEGIEVPPNVVENPLGPWKRIAEDVESTTRLQPGQSASPPRAGDNPQIDP